MADLTIREELERLIGDRDGTYPSGGYEVEISEADYDRMVGMGLTHEEIIVNVQSHVDRMGDEELVGRVVVPIDFGDDR